MKQVAGSIVTVILLLAGGSYALDSRTLGHVISIPIIEGAGVYSSVKMIQAGGANNTAAGITNIALVAVNAGLGAYTLWGKPGNYEQVSRIHRILGFAVTGAALWMTISGFADNNVANIDKGVSTGYTVLTAVPLVMFAF